MKRDACYKQNAKRVARGLESSGKQAVAEPLGVRTEPVGRWVLQGRRCWLPLPVDPSDATVVSWAAVREEYTRTYRRETARTSRITKSLGGVNKRNGDRTAGFVSIRLDLLWRRDSSMCRVFSAQVVYAANLGLRPRLLCGGPLALEAELTFIESSYSLGGRAIAKEVRLD